VIKELLKPSVDAIPTITIDFEITKLFPEVGKVIFNRVLGIDPRWIHVQVAARSVEC
jgi:hypothetical protein